jgi:formiminotetrahydrofolate cyclodeaminase
MISMVASLTKNIDQNKYIKYIDTIIDKLKDLYKQDIETFEEYLNVLKNKAETDEGKIIRKNKIEDLSKKLCYIPIETAKT